MWYLPATDTPDDPLDRWLWIVAAYYDWDSLRENAEGAP